VSNGRMTDERRNGKDLEGSSSGLIAILSGKLSGKTGESNEKLQSA
jgi:hypothetical protein